MASKLRVLGSFPELPALGGPSECVRVPSLSKRGVVAFRMRSVVSECGRTPKDVLSGAFKNLRRTVSTKTSMRMSRRFARIAPRAPFGSAVQGADAVEWAWRPVGDIARNVLKGAFASAGTEPPESVQ